MKIRWKNLFTSSDDKTIDRTTFLSRPREWHAILAGLVVGLTGSKEMGVVLALLLAGRKSVGASKLPDNLHFRDAAREPAYAIGGWVVGTGIHTVFWAAPAWLPI